MLKKVKAYAKVNIGLKVLGKRADGFHDIDSYFHLISLSDDITFTIVPSRETKVSIAGNEKYIQGGVDIMEKAALAFSKESGKSFDLKIDINKRIPTKAGLGGGSSDGAEVFKFLNTYYNNMFDLNDLMALSLSVGSDIPFFISSLSAAHVKGRGERIEKVQPLEGYLDLYFPSFDVSTKNAYAILDSKKRDFTPLPENLENINYNNFPNDFELAIPRNHDIVKICSCYDYFSLSGSGSTYFGFGKNLCNKKSLCATISAIRVNFIH